MKRVIKCINLVLCLVLLALFCVCPCECLDYSADSPSYITKSGCFYIEVQTSQLGHCTIILPSNYQFDLISTYKNSDVLYNTTSGTMSGTVITASGDTYNFRFQAFSNAQYYRPNDIGTSYTWSTLTINRLVSTNGSILGTNGIKVYNIPDSDKIIISVVLVSSLLYIIFGSVILIFNKRGSRYD